MTTTTLTLADFLLARIGDDEEVARRAASAPWEAITGDHGWKRVEHSVWAESVGSYVSEMTPGRYTAEHIARHDPARVLAECDAKRRIVENYRGLWETAKELARVGDRDHADVARNMYAGVQLAMEALALPYADHPDYHQEWTP